MTYEEQYLMHHGIEGQQWGVQNGPPYPLDSSISDGKHLKKEAKKAKGYAIKEYKADKAYLKDLKISKKDR